MPGVASRYVTRDLPALLENYSPRRQTEDGGESNRPATNFPEIPVDSNRFNCLVEKSGFFVEPRRLQSPIKLGGLGISRVYRKD